MAYQTRGRDPLIDSSMQAAIEKRGKELVGLALIGAACLCAAMLGSYTPDDPNWLLASDAPVQNWLGRFGASMSHPLIMIVGRAAWLLPVLLAAWGVRLAGHWGEERALGRVIFAPIAVALGAVYGATLTPGVDWQHSFGVGGLFGDTVLSVILTVLPFGAGIAAKLMSLIAGLAMLTVLAYALGFTNRELKLGARWVLYGIIVSYDLTLRVMGRTADLSGRAAREVQGRMADRMAERRAVADERRARIAEEQAAERLVPMPNERPRPAAAEAVRPASRGAEVIRREPVMPPGYQPAMQASAPAARTVAPVADRQAAPAPQPARPAAQPRMAAPKMPPAAPLAAPARAMEQEAPQPRRFLSGLFGRGEDESLRMPAPELPESPERAARVDAPDGERIRDRIASAIRARQQPIEPPPPPVAERPRGPRPLILDTTRPRYRGEPPLDAARTEPALSAPRAEPTFAAPRAEPALSASRAGPALTASRAEPPLTGPSRAAPARSAALPPAPDWNAAPYSEDDVLDAGDGWMPEDPAPQPALTATPLFETEDDPAPAPQAAPQPMPRAPEAQPRRAVVHTGAARPAPSNRAKAEAQPKLPLEDKFADYEMPPLNLLADPAEVQRHHLSNEALEENARMLESVLDDYGVKGEIVSVRPGPVVTMYELEPAPGLKASRVIGLADDIARSMSALSARVSTVPGRSVIGIELPNANREKVVLREILAARDFGDTQMKLPLALGKDIGGEPIVANLAKMPHLLIAGTTGSGKSVAINTMILSLLYRLTPEECRLIMIDPKMLELSVYDGIPHLLSPVVTDPKKAVVALKWVVGEMEERYRKMSKMGVRNIDGYNGRVKEALARGECFERTVQTGFDEDTGDPIFETEEIVPEAMPYIVVIVDEMADLMMVAGKEIEACIQRLAQMARASGIHLIMATQRPSVDVITGTIKANFPTRISFQVTSKIDSRTILGEQGAEQLLGMGDMLYMAGGSRITRVHGPFCSDEEVEEIVTFLKGFGPPDYVGGVVEGPDEDRESDIDAVLGLGGGDGGATGDEALYDQAVQIVARDRKCSTSYIQRKLAIGYNKAARLVEQMEEQGVVSASNHVGKREVLVPEPH